MTIGTGAGGGWVW